MKWDFLNHLIEKAELILEEMKIFSKEIKNMDSRFRAHNPPKQPYLNANQNGFHDPFGAENFDVGGTDEGICRVAMAGPE